MNDFNQNPLLNELFTREELQALRQRTLDAGLSSLKEKRRRSRVAKGFLLLPILGAAVVLLRSSMQETVPATQLFQTVPLAVTGTHDSSTKIISDRELFALFPNRPMALVGKPGHQQLVFLDRPRSGN